MKSIRFSKHALGYTAKRGFTLAEAQDAIRTRPRGAAELGRLDGRKILPFGQDWNGKLYATKQERPVFFEEAVGIVVITVYTHYFFAMKISYDAEVDALSVTFRETTVTTKHPAEGMAADDDSDGRLAGLGILDAHNRLGGKETMRHVELEGIDCAAPPSSFGAVNAAPSISRR